MTYSSSSRYRTTRASTKPLRQVNMRPRPSGRGLFFVWQLTEQGDPQPPATFSGSIEVIPYLPRS